MKYNGRYREPIGNLHKAYRLVAKGQKRLEQEFGTPICVPNCGICCETTCPSASGLEGKYAAEWLSKQKPEFYEEVIKRCEAWLVKDEEYIKLFGGIGTTRLTAEGIDRINLEAAFLVMKTSCPFLTEDKRCLIHLARPLVCRLYGITRIPGPACQRPYGKKENKERNIRGLLSVEWCNRIKKEVKSLPMGQPQPPSRIGKGSFKLSEDGFDLLWNQTFLATLIFMELKPQRFWELVYHDRIPTAKMLQFGNSQLWWEEEMEEHFDREAEVGFLVNPISGIPLGEEEQQRVTV